MSPTSTTIPQCKLCQAAPATQTGSHLLSAFMSESMLGARGEERGYVIGATPDLDYRINVGASQIVMDHLLCRGCEQRLSYVEGYISQDYIQKVDKASQSANFPTVKTVEGSYFIKSCDRLNSGAFFILIASILWRIHYASSRTLKDFKLTAAQVEQLRVFLNSMLPPYENFKVKPDKKTWLNQVQAGVIQSPPFSFAIITSVNKADKTANMLACPHFINNPYSLMLNEFILLVYFGTVNLANIQEDFYHLGSMISDEDLINVPERAIKVGYVSEDTWRGLISDLRNRVKEQKIRRLKSHYLPVFFQTFGYLPTEGELLQFSLVQAGFFPE